MRERERAREREREVGVICRNGDVGWDYFNWSQGRVNSRALLSVSQCL